MSCGKCIFWKPELRGLRPKPYEPKTGFWAFLNRDSWAERWEMALIEDRTTSWEDAPNRGTCQRFPKFIGRRITEVCGEYEPKATTPAQQERPLS